MTFKGFKRVLADKVDPIPLRHLQEADGDTCPMLCWQELKSPHIWGDNGPAAHINNVQLDYFSQTEYDPYPVTLEGILSNMDCAFYREGVTYDPDMEQWRTIWTVQFFGVQGAD